MDTVIETIVRILGTFMAILFMGLPLLAHFGFVSLLGWLLMRPSVAVWRQELIALRWRRVGYAFGFSPIVALPFALGALAKWGSTLPLLGWVPALPALGMGLILIVAPAIAGCWLALPDYEGEPFSRVRAWFVALIFTFFDAIGAGVVSSIIFS